LADQGGLVAGRELQEGCEPPAPGTGIYLRPSGRPRDIPRWFLASFAGNCACILVYTVFGFFFVRLHARLISDEMTLMAASGMTPLITPGDVHLVGIGHQLSSALFFGMTLGVLGGLICMVVTLPAWLSGRIILFDWIAMLCGGIACTCFSFGRELPVVSLAAGLLCPVFFVLPWALVLRTGAGRSVRWGRWAIFAVALVSPLALTLLPGSSFLNARDAMVTLPVIRDISDFYYEHTLLAADVIKPIAARSQNVIALSREIDRVGHIPHGTLWVRTQDPCRVKGARVVLAREELSCDSVRLPDDRPANHENRVFEQFGSRFDSNRLMRGGLGIFFYSGPMLFMTALLLAWLAIGLERMAAKSAAAALVAVIAYLALFAPAFHGAYLQYLLRHGPDRIVDYAGSTEEKERYLAVVTYPGALSTETLAVLMNDPSARIHINALIEAGERRDGSLLDAVAACTTDPQLNVRTKACWALGRVGTPRSLEVLRRVMREDPAWYVRDYAYAAAGRIRPEAKVVNLAP